MPDDLTEPCRWCDHPREGHSTRYAAGRGNHEWEEPKGTAPGLSEHRRREIAATT